MNEAQSQLITLSISCVYYDTNPVVFEKTLESMADALAFAIAHKSIYSYEIHLINNNVEKEALFLESIDKFRDRLANIIIHSGHGNIGYGSANNLVISNAKSTYHLILNPDVITAKNAISVGIEYLNNNQNVGLVAPHATNPQGEIEYLAKRMPTLLVILLRGLNNKILNRIFKDKLNIYAYKDRIPCDEPFDIELASGCFMLCKTNILKTVGGFSDKYFLYFEDFDLSQKIAKTASLRYLPTLQIVHAGGNTSKKDFKHISFFFKSALIFLKRK